MQFCLILNPSSKPFASTRPLYQVHGHHGSLARDRALARLQGDAGDKLTEEAYGYQAYELTARRAVSLKLSSSPAQQLKLHFQAELCTTGGRDRQGMKPKQASW